MDCAGLVRQIRDTTTARVYIAATGAGAGLQSLLWSTPGCSSFLVGGSFPYSTDATDEFLGFKPEHYCSVDTSLDLAMEAFMRAGASGNAVGIGLCGSVASTKEHRGEHRVFASAVAGDGSVYTHQAVLTKGVGEEKRTIDGFLSDQIGLNCLVDALGLEMQGIDCPSYEVTSSESRARERFFAHPYFRATGTREAAPERLQAALPGTFAPPHQGHFGMAARYAELCGREPTFWVTAEPPHKPPIVLADLLERARALRGHDVLFTEGEPLYLDKARRYPGCAFVVGADAFSRMLDPQWTPVAPMLEEFQRLGTRFYVTPRVVNGELVTVSDVPGATSAFAVHLPGRWDVSSSELRTRAP